MNNRTYVPLLSGGLFSDIDMLTCITNVGIKSTLRSSFRTIDQKLSDTVGQYLVHVIRDVSRV